MDLWGSLGNNYLHSSMIEDGGKSQPLNYTITGGAARHENVSAKTWRISGFADANWFWRLMVITTDQPRS